jgi:hypothetical protein
LETGFPAVHSHGLPPLDQAFEPTVAVARPGSNYPYIRILLIIRPRGGFGDVAFGVGDIQGTTGSMRKAIKTVIVMGGLCILGYGMQKMIREEP